VHRQGQIFLAFYGSTSLEIVLTNGTSLFPATIDR